MSTDQKFKDREQTKHKSEMQKHNKLNNKTFKGYYVFVFLNFFLY